MPGHHTGTFRASRGGPGWELEWDGDLILGVAIEAAKRGIDDINRISAERARTEHIWDNRTGQTEAAVFWREAELETVGTSPAATPHVWGEWGVENRMRTNDHGEMEKWLSPRFDAEGVPFSQDDDRPLTTLDVAMFLEFGTVKMEPRPWLYPVWDTMKIQLPAAIAWHYRAMRWSRPRGAGGRFVGMADLGISEAAAWAGRLPSTNPFRARF